MRKTYRVAGSVIEETPFVVIVDAEDPVAASAGARRVVDPMTHEGNTFRTVQVELVEEVN